MGFEQVDGHNGKQALVDETGRVINANFVDMPIRTNEDGQKFVMIAGQERSIKDLVIAHHGKKPDQCRPPEKHEECVFVDADAPNPYHISNLKYVDRKFRDYAQWTRENKAKDHLDPKPDKDEAEKPRSGPDFSVLKATPGDKVKGRVRMVYNALKVEPDLTQNAIKERFKSHGVHQRDIQMAQEIIRKEDDAEK